PVHCPRHHTGPAVAIAITELAEMMCVPPVQEHEVRKGGAQQRGRADEDAGAEWIHEDRQPSVDRVGEREAFQLLRGGDEEHGCSSLALRGARGWPPSETPGRWRIPVVREAVEHC